jgi:hypothetical protein
MMNGTIGGLQHHELVLKRGAHALLLYRQQGTGVCGTMTRAAAPQAALCT